LDRPRRSVDRGASYGAAAVNALTADDRFVAAVSEDVAPKALLLKIVSRSSNS
jgi:hypothetical protein